MSLDLSFYYDIEPNPETPIQIWDNQGRWRKLLRSEWIAAFPHFSIDDDYSTTETVFSTNITHNLNGMADAAGIYEIVWRPEEVNITTPRQMIEPLKTAIADMKARPDFYTPFSAKNGWGTYVQFIPWLEELLAACENYPDAKIHVSR